MSGHEMAMKGLLTFVVLFLAGMFIFLRSDKVWESNSEMALLIPFMPLLACVIALIWL